MDTIGVINVDAQLKQKYLWEHKMIVQNQNGIYEARNR